MTVVCCAVGLYTLTRPRPYWSHGKKTLKRTKFERISILQRRRRDVQSQQNEDKPAGDVAGQSDLVADSRAVDPKRVRSASPGMDGVNFWSDLKPRRTESA